MEGEASRWLERGAGVVFLVTFQRSLALKGKKKEELPDPQIPFPTRRSPLCGQGEKIKTEDGGVCVTRKPGLERAVGLGPAWPGGRAPVPRSASL